MKRAIGLLLFVCLAMTGCVKQETLEKITITFVCAFDGAPNDRIEFTIAPPKFQAGKSNTVTNSLLSKIGHSPRNITELMNMQLSRPFKNGKLSIILFDKELAAHGLAHVLDAVMRDALASRRMYMAVVDGKGKDILKANYSPGEEKGMYLYQLLNTNVRTGLVPRQVLHDFEYSYLGQGMDPYLPLIKLENEQVLITGLALFKDDKYVASLNEKQMRVMKLLLENANEGILETKLEDGRYISVKNFGSKAKYRIGRSPNGPKVTIDLHMNGEVIDTKGVLITPEERRKIKEAMEQDLTVTGKELIRLFKKEGIDPLGLGNFVRSKTRNWSEEKWKREYPAANVQLNVKVDITETGIRK